MTSYLLKPASYLVTVILNPLTDNLVLQIMQQETILVVEDFLAVQQFLRETLESLGYKTLGATNGNRAYEILVNHSQQINLVLTDYHMPDSTGYDLAKKIKANPQLEKIPIVFLTAE
jgi:CheY-like chemotaxis protein